MAGVSGSWGEGTARGEPVPGLLEILAGTAATPPVVLEALPGLTWSYSGGGYLIVAQVICDVTGLVLDDAMAELVLEPAGMTASTFRQPLPGSLEPAAAWGYHGGEPVPGGWRNQPDTGAVGLWTTPSDLSGSLAPSAPTGRWRCCARTPRSLAWAAGCSSRPAIAASAGGPTAGW